MSGFIGANTEDLRGLARHMDGSADQLDRLREDLAGRFHSVRWEGDDAHRAKGEFRTRHARKILQVAALLRETADLVRKNAQEQTDTSSGGGGGLLGLNIARPLPLIIPLPDHLDLPVAQRAPATLPAPDAN